jgi:hypothetical protein
MVTHAARSAWHVLGLPRQRRGLRAAVFGERAAATAEHGITDHQLSHASAHDFDVAGDIDAKPRVFRSAQPGGQPQWIGSAAHEVTIVRIDRRRAYPDQYFVVTRRWRRSLLVGEGLRSAVATTKDRVQVSDMLEHSACDLAVALVVTPVPATAQV